MVFTDAAGEGGGSRQQTSPDRLHHHDLDHPEQCHTLTTLPALDLACVITRSLSSQLGLVPR